MENKKGTRIGVYISEELLDQCDAAVEKSNADSRSEFICDAIEHYNAVLNMQGNSRVLTPALESVIGSKIALTEDRINRIMFKLGVEVAMMNNILAATHNIDADISGYDNSQMQMMLIQLADRLAKVKGKKQYGYLNAGTKKLVDAIVAELARDSRIQELYSLWYEQKGDVLCTYTNKMPDRIPLEQQKEFKAIRNAVVQAALQLRLPQEELPLSDPVPPRVDFVDDGSCTPKRQKASVSRIPSQAIPPRSCHSR